MCMSSPSKSQPSHAASPLLRWWGVRSRRRIGRSWPDSRAAAGFCDSRSRGAVGSAGIIRPKTSGLPATRKKVTRLRPRPPNFTDPESHIMKALFLLLLTASFTHAQFRAGFADREVRPDPGMEVPGGYGKAFGKEIHDPPKVRAAVFDDGNKRVALV